MVFPSEATRLHWSFEDPAVATGEEKTRVAAFRDIRVQIRAKLEAWVRSIMRNESRTLRVEWGPWAYRC